MKNERLKNRGMCFFVIDCMLYSYSFIPRTYVYVNYSKGFIHIYLLERFCHPRHIDLLRSLCTLKSRIRYMVLRIKQNMYIFTFRTIYSSNHFVSFPRSPISRSFQKLHFASHACRIFGFAFQLTFTVQICPSIRTGTEQIMNAGSNLKMKKNLLLN